MFAILVFGAPAGDLVTSLPGFDSGWPFKAYSGYLHVPGPFKLNPYDALSIHYQLHTSQRDPSTDPLVTWHQGGPGGSSIDVGLYTEMGYFRHSDQGSFVNPSAWNRVANMLYLESPAGSGQSHGFSECLQGGSPVPCHWDDVSQAEAYAHALAAFKRAFPELAPNDLYLTGESYFGQCGPSLARHPILAATLLSHLAVASHRPPPLLLLPHTQVLPPLPLARPSQHGPNTAHKPPPFFECAGQYGPNIAHYILTTKPFNTSLGLKGIAAGNACWGGTEDTVDCNGPNAEQNDVRGGKGGSGRGG
jgi:carboxypeptidase C (cathepsin A)